MFRESEGIGNLDLDFGSNGNSGTLAAMGYGATDEPNKLDVQNSAFSENDANNGEPSKGPNKINNKPKSEFLFIFLFLLDLISDSITTTEITIMAAYTDGNNCYPYCRIDRDGIYPLGHCFIGS